MVLRRFPVAVLSPACDRSISLRVIAPLLAFVLAFLSGCGGAAGNAASSGASLSPSPAPGVYTADVNSSGTVVGSFTDPANVSHGYVRAAGGAFTVF